MLVVTIVITNQQSILKALCIDPAVFLCSKMNHLVKMKIGPYLFVLMPGVKRKDSAFNAHRDVLNHWVVFLNLHIKELRSQAWLCVDDQELRCVRLEMAFITRVLRFYVAVSSRLAST